MVCSTETTLHWQPPLLRDHLNQVQAPAHHDRTLQMVLTALLIALIRKLLMPCLCIIPSFLAEEACCLTRRELHMLQEGQQSSA